MTTPPVAPSADPTVPVSGSNRDLLTGLPEGPPPTGGAEGAPDLILRRERMEVSTTWVPAETVRIHRRVVTETRMVPVEVRVEVLDVERLPLNDAPLIDAPSSHEPAQDLVILLHEEVPVVTVETRATERVTVHVRTVGTDVSISDQLKSEQVDLTTVPAVPRS